ncbi:type II toxin-antitoxin system PemI/MazE family antitoxin [Globicatella sulfidifaciens]|uniref:AbrB family transcriptional regulator n=1 Tax=Globicatella sulfidifaciens DSM 15739 TaxID=1121925 RepID=A0A1T4JMH8_9LACT|nr:hypothetical protein [Globicatella sulfidifaciens]SJZ31341.1 hypothetical protein SAMN02746011_00173 [Globicatella sulfidifaciens DSM 15739]
MLTAKTRIQGNSIVVTLPVAENIDLQSQKEYFVTYLEDGSIILTPKVEDPFFVAEDGAYYEAEVLAGIPTSGNEVW